MTREDIYKEIEQKLGIVPSFMRSIPDDIIEHEWEVFKRVDLSETRIPAKYKHLTGVAVSAATRCRYCVLFHTEAAKFHGATDEEIEEAVHFAKHSTGWSTYIHGEQIDFDEFKRETVQIMEHIKAQARDRAA